MDSMNTKSKATSSASPSSRHQSAAFLTFLNLPLPHCFFFLELLVWPHSYSIRSPVEAVFDRLAVGPRVEADAECHNPQDSVPNLRWKASTFCTKTALLHENRKSSKDIALAPQVELAQSIPAIWHLNQTTEVTIQLVVNGRCRLRLYRHVTTMNPALLQIRKALNLKADHKGGKTFEWAPVLPLDKVLNLHKLYSTLQDLFNHCKFWPLIHRFKPLHQKG